jgi:hypothetical protein
MKHLGKWSLGKRRRLARKIKLAFRKMGYKDKR